MTNSIDRRDLLRSALALGGIASLGTLLQPALPALAQGETVVPFTDVPDSFQPGPMGRDMLSLDTREIRSFLTANEEFFVVQHYGQPEGIDRDRHRLEIRGLVDEPTDYRLADLRSRHRFEQVVAFECGGNSPRLFYGLVGNARWGGVRLRDLLEASRPKSSATEVVFFGADRGQEEIRRTEVEQSFARSLALGDALRSEVMIADTMNGEPLPHAHGAPFRLIVPGHYGVAQVKWLSRIELWDRRFMGRFMARDYVTLRPHRSDNESRWLESSVSRIRLTSVIVRVSEQAGMHQVFGLALTDGTALEAIEIQVDGGSWQRATLDEQATQYSWKLFTWSWPTPSPGEHTLVSRAIDANGSVQPVAADLEGKVTRWENNAQFARTVRVG